MAPEFQKEDWHEALTLLNENRLPEKLREELQLGKRRADQALKKNANEPMSYFLVEFMGSHEFIWVRESDIVETFDPEVDPNVASAAGNVTKKRRSGHSSINPKMMSDAIEEGRWALEEFEILVSDPCGDADVESEYDEMRYTYDVMCQSDDEADELEAADRRKSNDSDVEEQNELLANNGCLDFSVEGRKKAKAKAAEMKKQKAALAKQEKSKEAKAKKDSASKKASKPSVTEEDTKQLAKLLEEDEKRAEARRKKRTRDHDKLLKELEKQSKKTKNTPDKRNPNVVPQKKARAEAFVKSFLIHKHKAHSDFHGAPFIPTNSVDPSGLLGMSLSFRGAAGEISLPQHKGKESAENPWDKIDATSIKESSQRCEKLQEQIELIEKELQKVNAVTARRLALYDAAKQSRDAAHQKYLDAGEEVKSSKKVFVSSSKKSKKKSIGKPDPVKSAEDDDNSGQTPIESSVAVSAVLDEKLPTIASQPANLPSENGDANVVSSIVEMNLIEAPSKVENATVEAPTTTSGDIQDSLIPSDAMPVKAEDIVAKSPDHNASSAMEVDVP
jgi:hypothetical protein